MGAPIGQGAGGGRGRYRPMAEINVTPFVDVMLVLLIVFMVTAPLLTSGVAVNLPKANAGNLPQDDKPLEITVDSSGSIFIGEDGVSLEGLIPRLNAISGNNKDVRLYVRADESLSYGEVMQVIAEINRAGFTKVALPAQPKGRN